MNKTAIIYFVLIVTCFGMAGTWFPQVLLLLDDKSISYNEIVVSICTYIMSVVVVEITNYILKKKSEDDYNIKEFINDWIVGIFFAFIAYFLSTMSLICLIAYKRPCRAIVISIIALIIAYIFWWIFNKNDQSFDPYGTLGKEKVQK